MMVPIVSNMPPISSLRSSGSSCWEMAVKPERSDMSTVTYFFSPAAGETVASARASSLCKKSGECRVDVMRGAGQVMLYSFF